jgi:hypothetical protein
MENFEKSDTVSIVQKKVPGWYKAALVLWGPLALAGGLAAAFSAIAYPHTISIEVMIDTVQVVVLSLLINTGSKYFTAKQLIKIFSLIFLLMAIIPLIFIITDTGGEISLGAIMLIVFVMTAVPQVAYAIFYGVARKIFPLSPYKTLVGSVVIHVGIFILLLGYLLES